MAIKGLEDSKMQETNNSVSPVRPIREENQKLVSMGNIQFKFQSEDS
jgi:hypothetical protein